MWMHPTRVRNVLGCCQARSALSKTHTDAFQLVRTAEIRPRDGFEGFAAVFATGLGFNLAGHSTTAKNFAAACSRHSVRGLRKNMDFRRLLENIDSSKTELWTILNIFVCIFDVFSVPINSTTREI